MDEAVRRRPPGTPLIATWGTVKKEGAELADAPGVCARLAADLAAWIRQYALLFFSEHLVVEASHMPPAFSQSAALVAFVTSPAKAGPVKASAMANANVETSAFMTFSSITLVLGGLGERRLVAFVPTAKAGARPLARLCGDKAGKACPLCPGASDVSVWTACYDRYQQVLQTHLFPVPVGAGYAEQTHLVPAGQRRVPNMHPASEQPNSP